MLPNFHDDCVFCPFTVFSRANSTSSLAPLFVPPSFLLRSLALGVLPGVGTNIEKPFHFPDLSRQTQAAIPQGGFAVDELKGLQRGIESELNTYFQIHGDRTPTNAGRVEPQLNRISIILSGSGADDGEWREDSTLIRTARALPQLCAFLRITCVLLAALKQNLYLRYARR